MASPSIQHFNSYNIVHIQWNNAIIVIMHAIRIEVFLLNSINHSKCGNNGIAFAHVADELHSRSKLKFWQRFDQIFPPQRVEILWYILEIRFKFKSNLYSVISWSWNYLTWKLQFPRRSQSIDFWFPRGIFGCSSEANYFIRWQQLDLE